MREGMVTDVDLRDPDRRVTVATYEDYITAQRAVDLLSDNKFPVDQVSIVGEDVRLVERVWVAGPSARGRRRCAERRVVRVADRLALRDLRRHSWFAVILVATVVGALWGAAFGAVAHASTGGKRDFQSISSLVAARYLVRVTPEYADAARQLLAQLTPALQK
jgi:hypothetical protein